MKVLHVVPMDLARGAQTYARAMRDELRRGSDTHDIVTLFESIDSVLDADHALDVPFGRGRKAGFEPRVAAGLARLIDSERPEVLVAHGSESLKYALAVAHRDADRPAVVAFRIGLSTAEGWRARLFGRQLRAADHLVGVSEELLVESHTVYGVDGSRMTLIPNGRDQDRYHPAASLPERPHLLWVGAFDDNKRPELFIQVVRQLRNRGLDLQASMVGNGERLEGLRASADRAGVDLLGRRSDVPELLRGASALMLTSRLEGMPGVFIEAGLTGLPVLTTPVSGAHAVLDGGRTGVIAEPDDLVDATLALFADRERRLAMGRAARARCLQTYSLQATAGAWTDVLGQALQTVRGSR